MKDTFDWYFKPTGKEIDTIWKQGILTVDTNVLLDLYRYHEGTRNSLIQSLLRFEGAKWLSHQAATEFFRNRMKVIISSEKTFRQAAEETEKLNASLEAVVNQLKSNRIIPSGIGSKLHTAVRAAISQTQTQIAAAKAAHPNFIDNDPILDQVCELFKAAVGSDFKNEDKKKITEEAERRKKEKIPPGYLDDGKDEDRPYGDYYLWLQILTHAKAQKRPIVFVTSERKDDWWEKVSGKTVGARLELLKEAKEVAGQRVLIYQTEKFLEYALERFKQPINQTAIEEIRAVNRLRIELEAAVSLQQQNIAESSSTKNVGMLYVQLKRPLRSFTVSGHLNPNMINVPKLDARLLSAPERLPQHRIRAGTGTTHDFNVHITCGEPNSSLPVGSYLFEYEAVCEVSDQPATASPTVEQ